MVTNGLLTSGNREGDESGWNRKTEFANQIKLAGASTWGDG
jgi:hypothetical protein